MCDKPSVVNNQPPHEDQLPVLRQAVASMLQAGVIEETSRSPYLSPIQVVPKGATESRFVLNCAALTPHLKAPRFQLPPPPFQRDEQVLEILGHLKSAKIRGSRSIYPWQATTSPLHHSLELSVPYLGRPHPEQGETTRSLERAPTTLTEVLGDEFIEEYFTRLKSITTRR